MIFNLWEVIKLMEFEVYILMNIGELYIIIILSVIMEMEIFEGFEDFWK